MGIFWLESDGSFFEMNSEISDNSLGASFEGFDPQFIEKRNCKEELERKIKLSRRSSYFVISTSRIRGSFHGTFVLLYFD